MHADRYKWIALSNTTLAILLATLDASITLIAMPDIFRGIHLDPLVPANSVYLLWMILGYLVVSSVLIVSLGRLGDIFGRVRIYNLGFVIYTVASLLLAVDWLTGACLLVRAEVFAQTGGYDELRFGGMYGEDTDWCRRIHAGGWQIWFDPAAVIVHAESASPLDGRTVQMYRGFYRYCALHLTRGRQRAMRAATWLALGPRWLLARDPRKRAVYRQILQLPVE